MKKWPNTPVWQRLEQTFKLTNGPSWRRAAAAEFGCAKSALRATIDRADLTRVDTIDVVLIESERRKRLMLRQISEAEQAIFNTRHANDPEGCQIEEQVDFSVPGRPIDPSAPPTLTEILARQVGLLDELETA